MAIATREQLAAVELVDLDTTPLRELNQRLHDLSQAPGPSAWRIVNPNGAHAVACGLDADVEVEIEGHVGYYCAGMNKRATVRVRGNAGTGLSFGALSAPAKEALGRGASEVGTSTTTGDGGMTAEEREHSETLVYQLLPSRYGMNPDDLRKADAIEVVVGQGAKPGGGGMLLGHKISDRVAAMRDLPRGIDQRSACRHPDWTGPDDLEIKIHELREITDWEKPIFVKVGATRTYYDTQLAVKAGADVLVRDGMQGGTAAHRTCSSSMSGSQRCARSRLPRRLAGWSRPGRDLDPGGRARRALRPASRWPPLGGTTSGC